MTSSDYENMGAALAQAEEALKAGEFPVGCVAVCDGKIIASAQRINSKGPRTNEIDHAEIGLLRRLSASSAIDPTSAHLVVYCTMEPCLMCFAALMLAGIDRVVWAYEDIMGGGSMLNRDGLSPLYRQSKLVVTPRVRREESLALFKSYFELPSNEYWQGSLLAEYTLVQ